MLRDLYGEEANRKATARAATTLFRRKRIEGDEEFLVSFFAEKKTGGAFWERLVRKRIEGDEEFVVSFFAERKKTGGAFWEQLVSGGGRVGVVSGACRGRVGGVSGACRGESRNIPQNTGSSPTRPRRAPDMPPTCPRHDPDTTPPRRPNSHTAFAHASFSLRFLFEIKKLFCAGFW